VRFQLSVHPVQSSFGAGTLIFHEIRQIRHAGQFVQIRRGQIFGFQHHGYAETIAGQFHGAATVVHAIVGVQVFPMRKQSWLAVVQQGRQTYAGVPVCGEIVHATFRQHRLYNNGARESIIIQYTLLNVLNVITYTVKRYTVIRFITYIYIYIIYLKPGQHELFRREFRSSNLITDDQRPNKA